MQTVFDKTLVSHQAQFTLFFREGCCKMTTGRTEQGTFYLPFLFFSDLPAFCRVGPSFAVYKNNSIVTFEVIVRRDAMMKIRMHRQIQIA